MFNFNKIYKSLKSLIKKEFNFLIALFFYIILLHYYVTS